MNNIECKIIGYVKRPKLSDEEIKDHSLVSELEILPEFSRGFIGIDEFSHIYVVFWMHGITRTSLNAPFSGSPGMPSIGVFATRAPIHPNPIGLSLVEIVGKEDNRIRVKGLDAIDGTPILDVKPYPYWTDSNLQVVTDFKIPNWLSKITNKSK